MSVVVVSLESAWSGERGVSGEHTGGGRQKPYLELGHCERLEAGFCVSGSHLEGGGEREKGERDDDGGGAI